MVRVSKFLVFQSKPSDGGLQHFDARTLLEIEWDRVVDFVKLHHVSQDDVSFVVRFYDLRFARRELLAPPIFKHFQILEGQNIEKNGVCTLVDS